MKKFIDMDADERASFLRSIESIKGEGVDFYLKIGEDMSEDFDVRIQALKVIGTYGDIKTNKPSLDRIINIAKSKKDDEYVRSEAIETISASDSSSSYIEDLLNIINDNDDDLDVRHAAFAALANNKTDEKCKNALHGLVKDEYFGRFAKNRLS